MVAISLVIFILNVLKVLILKGKFENLQPKDEF